MSGQKIIDGLRDAVRDLAPEREAMKEPAKRWVNWWRIDGPVTWADGHTKGAGDHQSPRVYPSKDMAETFAMRWLAQHEHKVAAQGANVWHLGAYPEGEAPR